MKAAFNIQLQGYPPANREARVELVNEATGARIERSPFLDGSLLVRDVEPGLYAMRVTHPNLVSPIVSKTVRLFPQITPTLVPVAVPPDLFRDSPIRDVPDADVGPVQQAATGVRQSLQPLAGKAPGEVIRAADWNTLAGAVSDLANAVLELCNLVAPRGHDHPEIAEKIDEVEGNIRRFAEAFGRSLLELRREIESQALRRNLVEVLETADAPQDMRDRLLGRTTELEQAAQAETPVFTSKIASLGTVLLNDINTLAQAQAGGADAFLARPAVRELAETAGHFSAAGTQVRAESELNTYRRTSAAITGSKFVRAAGGAG